MFKTFLVKRYVSVATTSKVLPSHLKFKPVNTGRDSFEITKTVISKKSLDNSRQQMRGELNRILAVVDEILAKDNLF